MNKSLAMFLGVAVLGGCEVSVFGSEPITLLGGTSSSGGNALAYACEEPPAAREARLAADDEDNGCLARCTYVPGEPFDCSAARAALDVDGAVRAGILELNLRDNDGLVMTVEVCDPDGVAFQLSDSTSGSSSGGDGGQSAHDADLILVGTTLHVRAASTAETPPSQIEAFVSEEGCSTRTIVVAEQLAYLVEADRGLCGPGLFRIDPPVDAEGTPDALWYLATEGSVDGGAEGSGLHSVDLCFW